MGGLAHYIERAGIATTQISLVRLHTEKMRPPRALWVPFELGRPLGVPGDADFQKRVLRASLNLFNAKQGPVLEDYAEDAPRVENSDDGASCPINFARPQTELEGSEAVAANLREEIGRLQPWYDRYMKEHARTSVGVSALAIDDIINVLAAMFDAELPASPIADLSLGESLRLVVDDLKAFYNEAMLAQPGASPNDALVRWFWDETAAGSILLELKDRCLASDDEELKLFGSVFLVPRTKVDREAG